SLITVGGISTLTFTIANPNAVPLTGVTFSDTLMPGLVVATPNGLTGSCFGGTITAVAGTNTISLTGASIPANSSCTFSVNITGTAPGVITNTTSAVSSNEAPAGLAAQAVITVVPAEAFQVRYISNLNASDGVINITNTRASATTA